MTETYTFVMFMLRLVDYVLVMRQFEGRVNHIKMIKRQMFGRAGLPLLRKRVLLTAKG